MGGRGLIILDTHIFLWLYLQPEKLPESIASAVKSENKLGLAAISLWETAMLNSRKRIAIPGPLLEWLYMAIDTPRFVVLPLTPEIAARSESLAMHGDPADRLITATAIQQDCPLATVDQLLIGLPELKTIIS